MAKRVAYTSKKRKKSQGGPISLATIQQSLATFRFNNSAFEFFPPLKRLQEYVEAKPYQRFNWKEAASITNQAPHHFSSYFHGNVGVTFRDWEKHRRFRMALLMLSKQDQSILQVAEACGFRNARTFQRQCQRWVGATPKTVRHLYRHPQEPSQAK